MCVSPTDRLVLRLLLLCGLSLPVAPVLPVRAQAPLPPFEFEVVSIRLSAPGAPMTQNLTFTPDGYHAHGMALGDMIVFANHPLNRKYWPEDVMDNAPSWVWQQYDFDAKVSEQDLPRWRSQGSDAPLLRAALRSAFAERCKLAVHLEDHQEKVLELVPEKAGAPSMKEAGPTSGIPSNARQFSVYAAKFVSGPSLARFYNTSMPALAVFLTSFSSQPVFDGTGFKSSYDFTLARDPSDPAEVPGEPRLPSRFHLHDLGLKLRGGSHMIPTIKVDRIQRPSPN